MTIKNYYNFNADGVNSLLSETEKEIIKEVNNRTASLKNRISKVREELDNILKNDSITFNTLKGEQFKRKKLAVDVDYNDLQKTIIFTHGKSNYKIWFLNARNKLCLLEKTDINPYNKNLFCKVIIDVKGLNRETSMTLNRFLSLIESGEFKITNKTFNETYLLPLTQSKLVRKLNNDILDLEIELNSLKDSNDFEKYDKLYEDVKKEVRSEFNQIRKGLVRDTLPDQAKVSKKKKNIIKKQTQIKDIWNSTVTNSEKAYLMGWLCKHIYSLRLKVVDKGVSDQVLTKEYPDEIYGSKYREKANSSGWDASSATLTVDSSLNAPEDIIKKLSTIKHLQHSSDKGETVFKGNHVSNLDFVLFLLDKYNKYGFKTGVKKLNTLINVEDLKNTEFTNNLKDFEKGFGF